MLDALDLKRRPKLDVWLRDRGLGVTALAERWGISVQGASRYLLPFGHRRRVIPDEARIADVLAWTRGEVVAADWYPPQLSGVPLPASVGDVARPENLPLTAEDLIAAPAADPAPQHGEAQ